MSEPDHIWLKPMPNLMVGQRPAAFPFFYIEPSKADFLPITQKFTGPLTRKQAEQIAPIGMVSNACIKCCAADDSLSAYVLEYMHACYAFLGFSYQAWR